MHLDTVTPVTVTEKERQPLEALLCQQQAPQNLVLWARIVLHWTLANLAAAAVERGIVNAISLYAVGRFLIALNLKLQRLHGWLNSWRSEDFEARCRAVSSLSHQVHRACPMD